MRLSSTILILFCLATAAFGQSMRRVVLVTVGPGDQVYELFGHNMIEVTGDRFYNVDPVFHWGNFDDTQAGFIWRFIQGRMMYLMVAQAAEPVIQDYRDHQRLITRQDFNFNDSQIDDLMMRCDINSRPQNATYQYDYFKDNCSTRVRDMLNDVTGGLVRKTIEAQQPLTGFSYRQHTTRLMQRNFFVSLGTDFLIGPSCDRPLTAWEDCFIPGNLAAYLKPITTMLPDPISTTRPPELASSPDRRLLLAAIGIVIAAAMVGCARLNGRKANGISIVFVAGWWFISGFGGLLMLYMWLFTDHVAAHANQNLLSYSPLAWIAIICLAMKKPRLARWPIYIAIAMMALSVFALLLHGWAMSQQNLHFILLALPLHLAAFLSVRRLTATATVGEVVSS